MLLFAVLACAKQPLPDTGRSLETGDTARGETGSAEAPAIGPCGPWSGVRRVGTKWEVRATESYETRFGWTGGGTVEVVGDAPDETVLHYLATFEGSESYFTLDRTETWRCDEQGAWWLRSDVKTEGRSGSADIGLASVRTFSPGWLVRPAALEAGLVWNDAFVLTTATEGFEATTADVTCASVAGEETERTVAAGTFTAIQLQVACEGAGAADPWLAMGTGQIDDGDVELVSYQP